MTRELDHDDLLRIRGMLMTLSSMLEEVLTDGLPTPPTRGRSIEEWRDAISSHEEWHECRWQAVKDAEKFLKETEGWV